MAASLAQDNVAAGGRDNSSANTLTVTFTKATTAGNRAILSVAASGNGVVSGIVDSRGNTWTVDKTDTGQGLAISVCSCQIGTAHQINDTLTVTVTVTSTYAAGIVSEWAGLATSSAVDKTAAAGAVSGTPTSGVTATRTQANELLFGAVAHHDASDYTAGTGFTLLTIGNSGVGVRKVSPEYQIVSSTGTDAATWVGSLTNYDAVIVTYKASASAPANTVAPAVTGTATVGSVLTSTNGTWTDNGSPTFTYQWQRGGVNIGSATSSTYTLVDADDATNVRCVVTDTDANGATSANSNAVAILEPVPTNSVAPAVTGTATVGSVLTTTNGTWTHQGGTIATYAYQWQRGGVNIGAATASTYTLVNADDATNVRCAVTATNSGGAGSAANSNAVAITEPVPTNTVAPAVTGTTGLGDTLTSTSGTWTHQGGTVATYTYQWQRDSVDIASATAATRVIASADQGHALRCVVTATNTGGAGTPANSNAVSVPAGSVSTATTRQDVAAILAAHIL